jgi:GNAT superfamily N-acetyltransferase
MELRDALPEDLPFLFQLYCDVRGPEVSAWGLPAGQADVFLRMQFDAQRRSYQASFPQATHQIVLSDGQPVGRRLAAHTADGLHLVDIALLAPHRNHGLGTRLIRELMEQAEAAGSALHLHVLRGNPAHRLYQRLGFAETAADAMYIQMAWKPGSGTVSEGQPG